jgi:hypothetical protein
MIENSYEWRFFINQRYWDSNPTRITNLFWVRLTDLQGYRSEVENFTTQKNSIPRFHWRNGKAKGWFLGFLSFATWEQFSWTEEPKIRRKPNASSIPITIQLKLPADRISRDIYVHQHAFNSPCILFPYFSKNAGEINPANILEDDLIPTRNLPHTKRQTSSS